MRPHTHLIASFAFAAAPLTAAVAQSASDVRPLPHTKFVLSNGLTAILSEGHALPIVSFEIIYNFGSRDDAPGKAGLAHFCEHIQTDGTPNVSENMSAFYRSFGGTSGHTAI